MNTPEAEAMNQIKAKAEMLKKLQDVISEYCDVLDNDIIMGCLETAKLQFSGFLAGQAYEKMKKEIL